VYDLRYQHKLSSSEATTRRQARQGQQRGAIKAGPCVDICINPDRYTYGLRGGSGSAIFDRGCTRVGQQSSEEGGDVVLLRATTVITGVRRRLEMTSALPDKEEREMLRSGKNSDWMGPRDSVLESCRRSNVLCACTACYPGGKGGA
jgi:hypothetical protein